jgi:hypothetical protein
VSGSYVLPRSDVAFIQAIVKQTTIVERIPEFAYAEFNVQLLHNCIGIKSAIIDGKSAAVGIMKLQLYHKSLDGTFPFESLTSCNSLQCINISYNNFVGQIPEAIGGLTALEELHMDHNQFEGKIPASIGNLQCLKKLSVAANRMGGKIPIEVLQLKALKTIDLRNNNFEDLPALEVLFEGDWQTEAQLPGCDFIY